MRIPKIAAAAALLVTATGCLPTRDNGADPALAPHADLSFVDATAVTGACEAPVDLADAAPILDLERGRCLGMIGKNSFDPQDTLGALHFRWDLVVSTSQDPAESGAPALAETDGQPIAILQGSDVRKFPVDQILFIQLTVTDSDGNKAKTQSKLIVHNTPPPPIRIPERAVAAGGPPWNPGTPWVVSLDARGVVDPDGDQLASICWDRPEGTVCSGATPPNPSDPAFVMTVPPTAGRAIASLRASDGATEVVLGRSVVDVRATTSWAAGGLLGTAMRRLDTGRRVFPFVASGQLLPVHGVNGSLDFILALENVSSSTYRFHTRTWPDFTGGSDAAAVTPGGPAFAAVSPDGTSAVLAANPDNSHVVLYPYTISAAGAFTAGPVSAPIVLGSEGHVGTNPLATIDSLGHIWVSQRWSGVTEADPDGTVLGHWEDPPSNGRVFAIHERPGANEMWFVRTPAIDASAQPITIHRIVNGVETVFDAGLGHAQDFTWVDGTYFWIGLDDEMALVDADRLASGATFDGSVIRTAPAGGILQFITDPLTSDVWGISIATFTNTRVATDGTVLASLPLGSFNLLGQFIDDAGISWAYDSGIGAVVAAEQPVASPLAASVVVPLIQSGSSDGTGGLWGASLPFFSPSLLEHVTLDGTVLATEDFASDGAGNRVPLPGSMDSLRIAPGTTTAWILDHDPNAPTYPPASEVITLDLSQSPPVRTLVVSTSAGIRFSTNLLEPSAPIPSSTPFLWTAQAGSPGAIGRMTPAGVFTSALALTTNERKQLGAARSLRSNGLCMASVDNTIFRSVWIPASGAPVALSGNLAATAGSSLPVAAVSPDTVSGNVGSGDVCWSVVQAPGSGNCTFGASTIRAWTSAGTLVASYTLSPAGIVRSIKPIDRNHAWVTVTRCDANANQVDELDYLINNGGTTLTRLFVTGGIGARSFLDDEVSQGVNFFPVP